MKNGQRYLAILTVLLGVGCNRTSDETSDGPADYEAAFIEDRIVRWNITVSESDWGALLLDPDTYVPADVDVDGVTYPEVGLKFMGDPHSTKKSIRIRFNKYDDTQEFNGLKRVNLRNNADDPSLEREALAYALMRDAGVPASRTSFVWVCVNSGPCGLHTQVEQVDKKFMEDRFDGDDAGNIYKVEKGGTLIYRGDDPASYSELHVYEKKTNATENDYSDIIGLMGVLADTDNLESQLPTVLDVDGFLTALAVNTWFSNMNSYQGTSDNMYLYRDSNGIFHYIPWDMNHAFGNYHSETGAVCHLITDEMIALDPLDPICDPGFRPLVENVLAVTSFANSYRAILQSLMASGGTLDTAEVIGAMNSMRTFIGDDVGADVLLDPFNSMDFDNSFTTDIPGNPDDPGYADRIPGMRPFIEARHAYLAGVLGG